MELLAGLAFGFLGSLHCAGMCGPLALALPVPPGSAFLFYAGRALYNTGRAVTYTLLGLVIGALGGVVVMAGWQRWLSIGAGLLLLIGVLLPSLFRRLQARIPLVGSASAFVRQALSRLMQHRSVPLLFVIGLLNGFLPCGFVYVALAAAATTGGSIDGALFMAGFGFGTVPVMFAVSVAGKHIGAALRRRVTLLAPAVTVLIAVIIILRGMNLGIPYISPSAPATPAATESHCH